MSLNNHTLISSLIIVLKEIRVPVFPLKMKKRKKFEKTQNK